MSLGSTYTIRLTTLSLAAHMVIIKGVKTFQNNASVEYSDLDILQMLGRAVSIYVLCIHTNLINTAHRDALNLVLYSLDLGQLFLYQ
jgi:replicative superfamily II helicase